jgi:epoxyqueuosine reductase
MRWIDEQRIRQACDPQTLLPGARSFIAVAAPYASGASDPDSRLPTPDSLVGRLARYARGTDYHDVLKARLRDLVARLETLAGHPVRSRVFVDDGPMVDREVALRAGLGFLGKNTCLLTPGAGSFTLLGTILTDLDLEPDQPLQKDCGACRLCLDACPTGALVAPHQLDARLCIAYLTIELRDPVPLDLRPALGTHLFGCDICQEVCPYNHGHGPIPWPELSETLPADVDLLDLLTLDEPAFHQRYRHTPVSRAKRRGLLRNAALLLGNLRDRRAVPALIQSLRRDVDPLVRGAAAWALHQIGGRRATRALATASHIERDPTVLAEIGVNPTPSPAS